MTHVFYTKQQLSVKPLYELKSIYTQIGCNIDVADKRRKHAWMEAIVIHQSSQIQAVAQAELNAYIEEQAAAIALEEPDLNRITLTTREITFYDHEVLAGEEVVAEIHYNHDDFETQRWVVYISGKEFRHGHTFAKAFGIVCHHHTFNTLPKHQSEVQPTQTSNAVLAQISVAADEFGLELLDDGIYDGDVKLGEVGYNNGSWWVLRTSSLHQEKIPCDSVKEAMWSLSNFVLTSRGLTRKKVSQPYKTPRLIVLGTSQPERLANFFGDNASPNNVDVLLNKPFDELTQQEWKSLKCIDTSALDEIFGMSTVKSVCPDVITTPLDEVFAVV
jgi:hypothetical protein